MMRRIYTAIVVVLIFASAGFASCGGQISQNVPAVVGNSGSLVNVTMNLGPGNGNIYTSIYPRIGTMTQDSIETAIKYAENISNSDQNCNLYITFGSPNTEGLIDGPSAGAALTTMTYAMLTNQHMRQDTIITGTIDESGNVGQVGGVYEKVKGAAENGAKYFITPPQTVYDMILLKKLEEQYGIKVLQTESEEEVIGFMLHNENISQPDTIAKSRPIPTNISQYNSTKIEDFRKIASDFLQKESNQINNLPSDNSESLSIKKFYQNEITRQQTIFDKGYYFSAANEAFLNYIDMMTVQAISNPRLDIAAKKSQVNDCLNSIKNSSLNSNNFEFVFGYELRKAWANDNINKVEIKSTDLEEDKYRQYNMLSYSQAWCDVGEELAKAASEKTGTNIDETKLKQQSEETLKEAVDEFGNLTNQDIKDRLDIATESDKEGNYGAAIFDSVYVLEMSRLSKESSGSAKEKVEILLNQSRTSFWANIYQSQATYLYSQNDYAGAYKIARFGLAIDNAVIEIKRNIGNNSNNMTNSATNTQQIQNDPASNTSIALGAALLATIAIVLIAIRIIGRSGNGGANNQRTRKAYRTEAKKA